VAHKSEPKQGDKGPVIVTRRIKRRRKKILRRKKKVYRAEEGVYEYDLEKDRFVDPEYSPTKPDTRPVYEYIPAEVEEEVVEQAKPVYSINTPSDGRILFIRRNTPLMTLEFIFSKIRSGEWMFEDLTFESEGVKQDFLEEARAYYLAEDDWVGIGWIHFYQDEFLFALDEFNNVLEKEPDNPEALMGRGVVKYFIGAKGGYDDCLRAVEQDPDLFMIVRRYIPSRELRKADKNGLKVRIRTFKTALISSSKDLLEYLLMKDIDRIYEDQSSSCETTQIQQVPEKREEVPKRSTFQSQYERQLKEYRQEINYQQIQLQT
jgi:tetratricopeptide (TPR) repeat protein